MMFVMDADPAAKLIVRAIEKRKKVFSFRSGCGPCWAREVGPGLAHGAGGSGRRRRSRRRGASGPRRRAPGRRRVNAGRGAERRWPAAPGPRPRPPGLCPLGPRASCPPMASAGPCVPWDRGHLARRATAAREASFGVAGPRRAGCPRSQGRRGLSASRLVGRQEFVFVYRGKPCLPGPGPSAPGPGGGRRPETRRTRRTGPSPARRPPRRPAGRSWPRSSTRCPRPSIGCCPSRAEHGLEDEVDLAIGLVEPLPLGSRKISVHSRLYGTATSGRFPACGAAGRRSRPRGCRWSATRRPGREVWVSAT